MTVSTTRTFTRCTRQRSCVLLRPISRRTGDKLFQHASTWVFWGHIYIRHADSASAAARRASLHAGHLQHTRVKTTRSKRSARWHELEDQLAIVLTRRVETLCDLSWRHFCQVLTGRFTICQVLTCQILTSSELFCQDLTELDIDVALGLRVAFDFWRMMTWAYNPHRSKWMNQTCDDRIIHFCITIGKTENFVFEF